LVLLAFGFSLIIGLILGFGAVRTNPPGVAGWLAPLSTVGLAMPSFFLGSLLLASGLAYVVRFGSDSYPLPMGGFGWDLHLVFPVLALLLRPAVQIAQITASTLSNALSLRYVVTARAVGNSWPRVRWYHALANALSTIILTQAASFRLLLGELVVVEWLFSWPGLGRLLAFVLIPSQVTSEAESLFFTLSPIVGCHLGSVCPFLSTG
jgi:peptide/nickel transport system permease protein